MRYNLMGARPKTILRPLTEAEQQKLQRVGRASSERVDIAKRAHALLAVAAGTTFTQAGVCAGLSAEGVSYEINVNHRCMRDWPHPPTPSPSAMARGSITSHTSRDYSDFISQLVERFNLHGVAVLVIAPGRGRKPSYSPEERARVVQEIQRSPDREQDQTATWSLKLLERALRKGPLPPIGATTIGRILHEDGYRLLRDRTWCHTGYALRLRKDGIYQVRDPRAQEKKE